MKVLIGVDPHKASLHSIYATGKALGVGYRRSDAWRVQDGGQRHPGHLRSGWQTTDLGVQQQR
jgi:hypothetical protein